MVSVRKISSDNALLWTLRVLVVSALAMAALLALVPAAGHDQLWFLLMAERWLHGATLYGPEIFDSNTPAIVWLSAIPAGLAGFWGLSVAAVGKLLVVLLEVGVAWFSWRILLWLQPALSAMQRLFLGFAFVSLFAVAAARDFGQRDHMAGLLCLPYVLMAAVEMRRVLLWPRVLAGLLAGVGVCLKPQLALVPIAVELVLLFWPRIRVCSLVRRPEPALLIVMGAAFLSAIRLFAPLYFSVTLPTLLATYWAIGHLTLFELFVEALQLHVLAVLAVAWFFAGLRRNAALRPVVRMLLVAGVAATAAYYVQGTGWYYQQLPGIGFFGAALALEVATFAERRRVRMPSWSPMAAAALMVLALGLTIHFSGYPFSREMFSVDRTYAIETPDPSFFSGLAPGTPVATLTTSVDDAMMPVFRYRLTWAQRTNNLWMLPAIFRAGASSAKVPARLTAARLGELSALQRQWTVEDLERWRPALVLVERCQSPEVHCQELEDRHDDLLAFFLADPAFTDVWRRYRFTRRVGPYDAYALNTSR
jgi:hypothetical protein